jgi:hypothetical protein
VVKRIDYSFCSLLFLGVMLILTACTAQRSTRPLLSASPSAAADNDIYNTDAEGRIHALRPYGTEQWALSIPDEIVRLDNTASRDIRIDYLAARSGGKLFGLLTTLFFTLVTF